MNKFIKSYESHYEIYRTEENGNATLEIHLYSLDSTEGCPSTLKPISDLSDDLDIEISKVCKQMRDKPLDERIVDNVNHPQHYQSSDGIECVDAIKAALGLDAFVAHCRATAIKYAWRSGKKKSHAEDLRKGAWYLTKAAEELEK